MKVLRDLSFIIITTLLCASAFAQKKDSTYVGDVKGIVKDSVHNYVLPSATISIFAIKDSSLLSYQLSNNFGEFHFVDLPVGIPLKMVVSYSGYRNFSRRFTISPDTQKIDLKDINVERSDGELEEVVVTYIPPVRMNGDTLEFNADAFKLDSNAVVEDLLRKLPGITIWGDGAITVNGRPVKNILVDGKPFFGTDSRIATQNLPKSSVDKIQVYREKNEQNPQDSTTNVNIKLKENKKAGYFSKMGGGYGTRNRFEADGSVNIYSPRTQFGIVAAANNTNKSANDVNTLMRNASYKGIGVSVDYQSDFGLQGSNQINAGGFTFQQDFIPDAGYEKNNRLTAGYFVENNHNLTLGNNQTITNLGGDSSLLRMDNNEANNISTNHHFDSKYEFANHKREFAISPSFNVNNNKNRSSGESSSSGANQGLQSTNKYYNEHDGNSKNITFKAGYRNKKDYEYTGRLPRDYQADYTFYAASNNDDQLKKTEFVSIADPTQNKNFDRKYNNNSSDVNQSLFFKMNDLKKFIFNYQNLAGIDLQFQNNLSLNTTRTNNMVTDRDSSTKLYVINNYLTNTNTYNTINEMPALNFTKSFNKDLPNRYQKSLSINFLAQAQFYNQKNVSQKIFQNFEHSYAKLVPNASVSYFNYQFGDHQTIYSLNYQTSAEYPSVDQLAPLADSSNVWYLQKGNPNLKPYYKQEVYFTLQNLSLKTKNPFNYNLTIIAGFVRDNIVDSSIYDNLGRNIIYKVNANGNKYLSVRADVNKAYKFKENQIQVNANTNFSISKNPNYVNGVLNLSDNFNNSTSVKVYYTHKDILSINLGEDFSFFNAARNSIEKNRLNNSTKSTSLSGNINFTKKASLSSNITYNRNTSSGLQSIDFTIWNASANYRFLKENNLEIKLSAMDLLHQNINIISYGSNNYLVRGTTNVLQQYFMITLAYFPRKFGKK